MEFPPPACHGDQSTCTEADWVQCAECARLICSMHEEVGRVRHAGKYAATTDNVCAPCAETLFERGEVAMIKNGYRYVLRR